VEDHPRPQLHVPASGLLSGPPADAIEVREPDTGLLVDRVPVLGEEEVRGMVGRARAAGGPWSDLPFRTRAAHLKRLRQLVVERADEIAETVSRETGKPPIDVYVQEILVTCDHLGWTARAAPRVLAYRRRGPPLLGTHRRRVRWEPYGVAGIITPWNFPFVIPATAAASALAAGNAVVLKPSELTPGPARLLADLAAEALPDPDLVLVATGDGRTGRALVDAPVDVLSFTGSVATGRTVMEGAARHLTPPILELGGKDAMIVLEDADLASAARAAVWGAFFHAGQVCQSVERVFVHRSRHDELVRLVLEETSRLRVGRRDSGAPIGALTRPEQLELIEAHVRDARERGARVLLGGEPSDEGGRFYPPTVLSDVTPDMRIMREETFGPVLPVAAFDDEDEAVRLANATPYGLDAYVWTEDRARGWALGRRLRAGSVMVNDCVTNYGLADLPFGGVKESGLGRIHGEEGLRSFAYPVAEAEPRLRLPRQPWWFPPADRARWVKAWLHLRHGAGLADRVTGALQALRGN